MTLGPANGDVTLYLFADYACPSCRAMEPDLLDLVASDKGVRIVLRDGPVLSPLSIRAARFAIVSAVQGRRAEFDEALMRHGGSVDEATLQSAASRAGVAWRQLLVDYASHRSEIDGIIADSMRYARAFGIVGTPTLVIGPYLIAGRQSRERLRQLIDQARKGAS